jgi:hypothetical protein
MAWVRLDDGFLDHPKFLDAGPLAGYLAISAIAWSNRNLTDGFIPRSQVRRLVNFDGFAHHMWMGQVAGGGDDADSHDLAEELVACGLWERAEGGFVIHDYNDYQERSGQIRAKREKTARRQRRWQEQRRVDTDPRVSEGSSGDDAGCEGALRTDDNAPPNASPNAVPNAPPNGLPNAVSNGHLTGAPNPNPIKEEQSSSSSKTDSTNIEERADVESLCRQLADRVEANGSKRPSITAKWRDACRLLIDRDGRTVEQVEQVIDWSQADAFWRSNVLSMPKLREQFDQLTLKMKAGGVRDVISDADFSARLNARPRA